MLKQIIFYGLILSTLAAAAPSDDLLGYWNLDNNTLDTAPSGTTNDNGTWVGTSSYSATDSQFGSALSLSGNSYVSIPSSDDVAHTGGSITLSVWCKVGDWDRSWQALISKGDGPQYRIARRANDANQIAYAGGSGDISGGAVNDDNWHHILAISAAGENTALYVDGVLVATGVAPSLSDSGLPLLLGENPQATGREWIGGIDDVALFGDALSEQQAQAIYNFGINYDYPMSEAIQILDAHDQAGSVSIGPNTWTYQANDSGSGTFVLLGSDGSGVDVSTGPSITTFDSNPIFITSGASAILSWQIEPPFSAVSIDNGVGSVLTQTDVSGAGSISVTPTVSTFYTISATNVDGTTLRSTTLFVDVDPSTPRINEFVADNSNDGLLDEDGDSSDWIEIYNPGPNAADLSTFYLTDDELLLNKWSFPAVIMQPDTYLVVFASSKNRATANSELHTNFNLSAGGEYLALTRNDGSGGFSITAEFTPDYPSQEEGFSYGLAADGLTLGYLAIPTPNSTNGAVLQGFVEDTTFDIDRGFFTSPFNLTISSATTDAQIRYTTDGSEPTITNGLDYTGPVNISATTTIRAAAFKTDFVETNVDTHTYFFLEDIRTQFPDGAAPTGWPSSSVNGQVFDYGMDPDITTRYTPLEMTDALSAIPSVSISIDQEDLTGSGSQGIYVNPSGRGRSWERKASFEIIHPDGTTANVQSNCGLRVRGGFSRSTSNPKHAFRLFFRGEYGDSKLNYPLFGSEGVDEFDKVDLRTSQNYSWAFQNNGSNTFLREVLGRDLQGSFGHPYTRSRYYHLYLNGIYWGLYMTQERAEANHGAAYLGGNTEDYDTIKSAGSSGGYDTEATDGSFASGSDWNNLWSLARTQQSSPTIARFMEMQGLNPDGSRNPALPVYLDVDNLIDYQMVIGYTGNYDAPVSNFVQASNNWYGIRDRVRDGFGFQFFVHDGEHSMGAGGGWNGANDRMNTTNGSGSRDVYNKSNPAYIHFDLAEGTEEYRMKFADRAHKALFNAGLLTQTSVLEHMNARRSTVADVIIAESARWGDAQRTDPFDAENWDSAVNSLSNVIDTRSDVFLGHLRIANLYPDLDAPFYSQHGGVVSSGSTIDAIVPTNGTQLYYMIGSGDLDSSDWSDDLDPRLIGGGFNSAASVLNISGGGGGVTATTYINNGDNWAYLDDGSNQGTTWRASAFDDSSWMTGPAELGYGDGDEATTLSFGPDPTAKYATTYFRKTVNIPNPSQFGEFELNITFDDAYVVYVNGVEVARHNNLPVDPAFDFYSGNTVGNNAIDNLSIPTSSFAAGNNTIAVEMHQGNDGSSDLSFNLELIGNPPGSGNTVSLTIPDTITGPVWIKSRTYDSVNDTWSALNEAFFSTTLPASSMDIVISEVHYHPSDPTSAELAIDPTFDKNDFEFIEIMNISGNTADLGSAAFINITFEGALEGIEFTFPPGTLIAPGERLVIVENSAAFAARYPSVAIAGTYSGALSNSGEWITLVDMNGSIIDSFRYDDNVPWPESADGDGFSLVRLDPQSDLDPTLSTSWLASSAVGGSPGADDGLRFTGDPLADDDGDGYVAILEYAAGLSDDIPSHGELFCITQVNINGTISSALSYREDPDAVDAQLILQVSPDLTSGSWSNVSSEVSFLETTNDSDGIPRHTFLINNAPGSAPRNFFRLFVQENL
ncbi:MAG: lamin tail domain-containing protein [Roseibacillus sp.]